MFFSKSFIVSSVFLVVPTIIPLHVMWHTHPQRPTWFSMDLWRTNFNNLHWMCHIISSLHFDPHSFPAGGSWISCMGSSGVAHPLPDRFVMPDIDKGPLCVCVRERVWEQGDWSMSKNRFRPLSAPVARQSHPPRSSWKIHRPEPLPERVLRAGTTAHEWNIDVFKYWLEYAIALSL